MKHVLTTLLVLLVALMPSLALAQSQDRTAFGGHAHVLSGEVANEAVAFGGDAVVDGQVVHDVAAFGGDVIVTGEVLGDAVAFGGDVVIRDGGQVHGEVTSMGGQVRDERASDASPLTVAPASHVEPAGPIDAIWRWVQEAARSLVAHVMLFLLGLLLIGLSRERLRALQTTMIRDGVKTAATGMLGYVAAVVAIVLLCVTLVGIPAAVILGVALPVATYVGLAAAATVIGAALPLPQLKDNEVLQLAAGVGLLFVCSLVPFFGGIATAVIACLGFGALVRTRFSDALPGDLPSSPEPTPTAS